MTNEEIIEKCAKALNLKNFAMLPDAMEGSYETRTGEWDFWNPLVDAVDVIELVVRFKIDVTWFTDHVETSVTPFGGPACKVFFKDHSNEKAAYFYAVSRLVARINS